MDFLLALILLGFPSLLCLASIVPDIGYTNVLGTGLLCGPVTRHYPAVADCLYISEKLFPHDVQDADPGNLPQWSPGASNLAYRTPHHITHGTCRIDVDLKGGSQAALGLWSQLPDQVKILSRFCWARMTPTLKDFRGGTFVFGKMGLLEMKVYRNPDTIFLSNMTVSTLIDDSTS